MRLRASPLIEHLATAYLKEEVSAHEVSSTKKTGYLVSILVERARNPLRLDELHILWLVVVFTEEVQCRPVVEFVACRNVHVGGIQADASGGPDGLRVVLDSPASLLIPTRFKSAMAVQKQDVLAARKNGTQMP